LLKLQRILAASLLATSVAMLVASLPADAWDRGKLSDYHDRRARLVRETGGGLVVLFGYAEQDVAVATTQFRQNENFYYLTGWNQPDAAMLLVPKPASGTGQPGEMEKEILFIPPHDYRREKRTGPKLGPEDPGPNGLCGSRKHRPAPGGTSRRAQEIPQDLHRADAAARKRRGLLPPADALEAARAGAQCGVCGRAAPGFANARNQIAGRARADSKSRGRLY
jgi:Aminopeptidase P, N-terminal domain